MALRKYQLEALEACKVARQQGSVRGLIVIPTGGGKTVVLSKMPDYLGLQPHQKMIVLVHRDELVFQTKEKLEKYNPERKVGIEKAEFKASLDDQLVVASVQTIGRNKYDKDKREYEWCERIQKFNPDDFRFLVVDEAHHSLGDSYKSVLAYFGCLKGTQYDKQTKCLIGVTATPNRGDNLGLEAIFDSILYSKTLIDMIEDKFLCDIKAFRIDTTVDLSEVRVEKGDFAIKQLEKTVNTPERNNLIVDKYKEHGEGHRGIAFTVDIQHSVDLAETFNQAGIRAFALSGKTPTEDRRKVLQLFRDGYYRVLSSCGILNEGFDDPAVTVGLMARPTKSGLLYRQQIGRCLRPSPSPEELADMRARGVDPPRIKTEAIILDFCDVSGRHTLHTAPTLFGMSAKMNLKGKKAGEIVKEINQIIEQKKLPLSPADVESLEKLKATAQRVDLLAKPKIPEHVRRVSPFTWIQCGADSYSLALPDYTIIRVTPNLLGQYEIAKSIKGIKTVLGVSADLDSAIKSADNHIPADARYLLNGAAGWRTKPVSDAQLGYLWKIDHQNRRTCGTLPVFTQFMKKHFPTCGHASDRINELNGRR